MICFAKRQDIVIAHDVGYNGGKEYKREKGTLKRLCAGLLALVLYIAAAGCAPAVGTTLPQNGMKEKYIAAAGDCLRWVGEQMLTFDSGTWGVYERIRITKRERVSLCRPDTASEYLLAVHLYRKATGSTVYGEAFDNVLAWLTYARNGSEAGVPGGFPFALVDGKKQYVSPDRTLYQNDNGKIISNLLEIYRDTKDARLLEPALSAAEFWLQAQRPDGSFLEGEHVNHDAHSPFSVLWMLRAMYDCYQVTADARYLTAAERALELAGSFFDGGRLRTAYELERCENWRPVSSENYIGLLNFCAGYLVSGDERLRAAGERLTDFCLSLIDPETGGVLNCTPDTAAASQSNDPAILDLVYTQGFALNGMYYAGRALNSATFRLKAERLAAFLCEIQMRDVSPLLDGAWRGMYDLRTQAYGGKIHESSSAEEGGADSVYAGWCSLVNAIGLLRLAMPTQ